MEVDIKAFTDESKRISNEEARCRRLRQIPGFGPPVSTATMAAIGNGDSLSPRTRLRGSGRGRATGWSASTSLRPRGRRA